MVEDFILGGLGILVLVAGLVIEVKAFLLKRKEKNLLRILYNMEKDEANSDGSGDSYRNDVVLVANKRDLAQQENSGPLPEDKNYPSIKLGNYSRGIELTSPTRTIW